MRESFAIDLSITMNWPLVNKSCVSLYPLHIIQSSQHIQYLQTFADFLMYLHSPANMQCLAMMTIFCFIFNLPFTIWCTCILYKVCYNSALGVRIREKAVICFVLLLHFRPWWSFSEASISLELRCKLSEDRGGRRTGNGSLPKGHEPEQQKRLKEASSRQTLRPQSWWTKAFVWRPRGDHIKLLSSHRIAGVKQAWKKGCGGIREEMWRLQVEISQAE